MGRVVFLLLGLEIGGCWLLVSTFGLKPVIAFGIVGGILVALVTAFILYASWSRSD